VNYFPVLQQSWETGDSGQAALRRASLRCGTLKMRTTQRSNRGAHTMDQQQPVQGQVQIKADEKELQGEYSNLVMIHHNLEEFTLNFIYIFPNGAQGKLLKSMIVSPGHAKRIFRALGENIARYEAQFGTIKEMPEGGPTPNVGFVQ
jgi:Protein of unknown function (DUF3467)